MVSTARRIIRAARAADYRGDWHASEDVLVDLIERLVEKWAADKEEVLKDLRDQ